MWINRVFRSDLRKKSWRCEIFCCAQKHRRIHTHRCGNWGHGVCGPVPEPSPRLLVPLSVCNRNKNISTLGKGSWIKKSFLFLFLSIKGRTKGWGWGFWISARLSGGGWKTVTMCKRTKSGLRFVSSLPYPPADASQISRFMFYVQRPSRGETFNFAFYIVCL